MIKGTRDEQALRRRLALLAHLQARPRGRRDLLAALESDGLLNTAYLDDPALRGRIYHQFRSDLKALRAAGCHISHDRRSDQYHWANSPFGLGLNSEQLFALAIIINTFEGSTALHGAEIAALLDHLAALLPAEARAELVRKRRAYTVDLGETSDYSPADRPTVAAIERAIEMGQQLELRYRPSQGGGETRHLLEPRPLVYRNGHVYLPAYNVEIGKTFNLRLDNIVPGSARVLPRRAQPSRPPPPVYTLHYRLSPTIARHHVSTHFPGQQVEPHEDGSATVTATVSDLFAAGRVLLAYGEHCCVTSPPQLVNALRATAQALYHLYCSPEV